LESKKKSIRNVGILAHVDAGKTTLTEHLLYRSGAIRRLGDVDKGTTQSDSIDVEKERGISVRLSHVSLDWDGMLYNLIDTPGHVDFSADVEYSLRAIDGAIILVSAVEGVQAHTTSLLKAVHELGLPAIVFINKIDRAGADVEAVLEELRKEIPLPFIPMQVADGEGLGGVSVHSLDEESSRMQYSEVWDQCQELVAEMDEELLEKYFEQGELQFEEFRAALIQSTKKAKAIPVLMGAAKLDLGMEELMDCVGHFLPEPVGEEKEALSAVVYKVEPDKVMGKVASVRVFQGMLKNRMNVWNATQGLEEKITRITKGYNQCIEVCDELGPGEVGLLTGLSEVHTGDVLGAELFSNGGCQMDTPLLTVRVEPREDKDYPVLAEALQVLNAENPMLNLKWLKGEKELHIQVMGKIQVEILEKILETRFGIESNFTQPSVIYKETPVCSGEGYERYTMPKPCWAVVKFRIEPGERGSGVVFESRVSVNDIARKYQHEVERTIPKALEQGIKGWEVTDLKITLTEGEDHVMHSRPGDFCVATPMGVMNGLVNTDTKLLEPILNFRIVAARDLLGTIAGDLTRMRARFANPEFYQDNFILKGEVPLATSMDYSIQFNSRTGGKGKFMTSFSGYQDCPQGEGECREYRGISPLDRSKWILKARKAIQE
jgi:ribosomal protection tetracycline resistance protein